MKPNQRHPSKALSRLGKWETETPVGIQVLWFNVAHSKGSAVLLNSHSHPFYEVHFVLSGEVSYECAGEIITIQADNALLVPPQLAHRICPQDSAFEMIYLGFQLMADAAAAMPLPQTAQLFPFSEIVRQNYIAIANYTQDNDIFTPTFIGTRILEVIHSVCKSLSVTLPPMPVIEEDPRLVSAKQFIEKNLHWRIGCEDVATACGISRKQLNRIFKKHTGRTLNDYLLEAQLLHAEKLVLQSDCNIKQLGFQLGFKSEGSFGIYFKRYFGVSPKTYREQFRDTNTNFLD